MFGWIYLIGMRLLRLGAHDARIWEYNPQRSMFTSIDWKACVRSRLIDLSFCDRFVGNTSV